MITIVGADWCTGCKKIKRLARKHGLEYKYVCIPPGKAGWDLVEALTGRRSIPQIFYHFNGLKEFNEALNSIGELSQ